MTNEIDYGNNVKCPKTDVYCNIHNIIQLKDMSKSTIKELLKEQCIFSADEIDLINRVYNKFIASVENNEMPHMDIDIIQSTINDLLEIINICHKDNKFINLYDIISYIVDMLCDKELMDKTLDIYIEKSRRSEVASHKHFLNTYIRIINLIELNNIDISKSNKKSIYKFIKLCIEICNSYKMADNNGISDKQITINKLNKTAEVKEINKGKDIIAKLFEYLICEYVNKNNLFGTECKAVMSSRFDDLFNGIDSILEFNTKFNNTTFNGISFDVTIAQDKKTLIKKFSNIKSYIISGIMPTVKYYISSNTLKRITIENIPKIILNINDKNTFVDMLKNTEEKNILKKNAYNDYEYSILSQIYIQLIMFAKYTDALYMYIVDELDKQEKFVVSEALKKDMQNLIDLLKTDGNDVYIKIDLIKTSIENINVNQAYVLLKELLHILHSVKIKESTNHEISNVSKILISTIKKILSNKIKYEHPIKRVVNDENSLYKIYKDYYMFNYKIDDNFKYMYEKEYYMKKHAIIAESYKKSIDTFTYIIIKKLNTLIFKKNKNQNELRILSIILGLLKDANFKDIMANNLLFDMSNIDNKEKYDKYRDKLIEFILLFFDKINTLHIHSTADVGDIKRILDDIFSIKKT